MSKSPESTTQIYMRKMQESIWGRIESLESKDRLKLCLEEGLYTPVNPQLYTRARVAAMLKQAAVPRWLAGVSGRQL